MKAKKTGLLNLKIARKSKIKEYHVFDISSLKEEAEVLENGQLQAPGFTLVNPISFSLKMVPIEMVLPCEEVGNLDILLNVK